MTVWEAFPAAGCWSSVFGSRYVKQFGSRVRELRQSRNMSQEQLADHAGLHRTAVSLIERGRRAVRIETIERLSYALGVQPRELMPDLPQRRESPAAPGRRRR